METTHIETKIHAGASNEIVEFPFTVDEISELLNDDEGNISQLKIRIKKELHEKFKDYAWEKKKTMQEALTDLIIEKVGE